MQLFLHVFYSKLCSVNLYQILGESFNLLKNEPRFFVPRLISTSISTIWFIVILEYYLFNLTISQFSLIEMVFYFVSGPFIVFLGVFVSVMLACMVDKGPDLYESFVYTLGRFKSLLAVTMGILALSFVISIPLSFGIVLYPVLGLPALVLTGILSIAMLLVFSFAIYFLPIALVEDNRVVGSLKKSVKASRKNSLEVSVMLMFSLMLLVLASLAQGSLQTLGYLGFGLSRFVSALITTYIFVVSPKLYLSEK